MRVVLTALMSSLKSPGGRSRTCLPPASSAPLLLLSTGLVTHQCLLAPRSSISISIHFCAHRSWSPGLVVSRHSSAAPRSSISIHFCAHQLLVPWFPMSEMLLARARGTVETAQGREAVGVVLVPHGVAPEGRAVVAPAQPAEVEGAHARQRCRRSAPSALARLVAHVQQLDALRSIRAVVLAVCAAAAAAIAAAAAAAIAAAAAAVIAAAAAAALIVIAFPLVLLIIMTIIIVVVLVLVAPLAALREGAAKCGDSLKDLGGGHQARPPLLLLLFARRRRCTATPPPPPPTSTSVGSFGSRCLWPQTITRIESCCGAAALESSPSRRCARRVCFSAYASVVMSPWFQTAPVARRCHRSTRAWKSSCVEPPCLNCGARRSFPASK